MQTLSSEKARLKHFSVDKKIVFLIYKMLVMSSLTIHTDYVYNIEPTNRNRDNVRNVKNDDFVRTSRKR